MTGIFDIFGIKPDKINLFPKTTVEEIIQNVAVILTTVRGTVPLDRTFGLKAEFIDDPSPRAIMKLSIDIVESIQEREPRVEIMEIDFVADTNSALNGKFYPKVKVRIPDDYIT